MVFHHGGRYQSGGNLEIATGRRGNLPSLLFCFLVCLFGAGEGSAGSEIWQIRQQGYIYAIGEGRGGASFGAVFACIALEAAYKTYNGHLYMAIKFDL